MVGVVEASDAGVRTDCTFAFGQVDPDAWHARHRIVYPAPPAVVRAYLPLASATFARMARVSSSSSSAPSDLLCMGDVGLGLVLDARGAPAISVEAAALLRLVEEQEETTRRNDAEDAKRNALERLAASWAQGMCLWMVRRAGVRGCFAEHRLWSAVLARDATTSSTTKTPYARPTVRAWFPPAVLDDLHACVGVDLVRRVARVVAERGFDGAPDLVLYWPGGGLRFVEVKSATDRLKPAQVDMLRALERVPGVAGCDVWCPRGAAKRHADALRGSADTDDDE